MHIRLAKANQDFPCRALALSLLCTCLPLSSVAGDCATVPAVQLQLGDDIRSTRAAAQASHNIFLLDSLNHRVLVYDQDLHVIRQIARIGQDPDGLFNPSDFTVDANRDLYVLSSGGRQIKIFSFEGKRIAVIALLSQASGIAVTAKHEIIVGDPHSGHLLSVYEPDSSFISHGVVQRCSQMLSGSRNPCPLCLRLSRFTAP